MKTINSTIILFLFSFLEISSLRAQSPYKLYGMTSNGGANGLGVLFEWDPVENSFINKHNFDLSTGVEPWGSLIMSEGKYFGMTQYGGINNMGSIFEWDPVFNSFKKKIDFSPERGSFPVGSLLCYKGKLYGLTQHGGKYGDGVLFEWEIASNTFKINYDFNMKTGAHPSGNLIEHDGKFYGMTNSGGNTNDGVIFEWNPSGNVYSMKVEFNFMNGASPYGSLVFNGGFLFGVTYGGGSNGKGVLFSFNPSKSIYEKKMDFDGSGKGSYPFGALVINGEKLYGTTQQGGTSNAGIIYEWNPMTNTFTNKWNFDAASGGYPFGGISVNQGYLYGMARGGNSSQGVLYQFNLASNTYTKKLDFAGSNGANAVFNTLTAQAPVNVSPLGSIIFSNNEGGVVAKLYPNPVQQSANLFVTIDRPQEVKWQLKDFEGRIVHRDKRTLSMGSHNILLDMSRLNAGAYTLSLEGNSMLKHISFIKQ